MTLSVRITHQQGAFALDVAFHAPAGITAIFGRSGAGKSTVLRTVAGLLRPDQAQITLGDQVLVDTNTGRHLPTHQRRIGVIFQEDRLFPHLTVAQNLNYGRWLAPKRPSHSELDRIVELLGIGSLLSRRPTGLSGGEKQRVAIGRALLMRPRLLLADEPLAALDEARKAEILPYFERMRDEYEIPILYVSHAATEVARLATQVVALQDGRVLRHGTAAEVLSDPTVAPQRDMALGADIQAVIVGHTEDGLTTLQAGGAELLVPRTPRAIGDTLRIRIAAHDVILARHRPEGLSALNILACQVAQVTESPSGEANISLSCGALRLEARVARRTVDALNLAPGVACYAVVKSMAIGADMAPQGTH